MSKISMPSKIFGTVLSHGLRGRMLTKSELQTLAEARDIEELVGRRDIIVKSLVAKNLEEAVAAISGSEFGEDATRAAAIYKEKDDLRIFDVYLDHVFYHELGRAMNAESQSPDVKKVASTDIDSYNVLAILRGKFWNLSTSDINDLIVTTTSKVTRETLQKMINVEKIS